MAGSDLSCSGDQCCNKALATERLSEGIRKLAFRHLLETHQPVSVVVLTDELGESRERVDAAVSHLDRQGLIRRNQRGDVVGSEGLSVEPSRHELHIGDQQFWTWCAYDAVGILAALGANGRVRSKSPLTGTPIEARFNDGSPEANATVLFIPDFLVSSEGTISPEPGVSVYDNLCPQINLFENPAASRTWAEQHRITGRSLSLPEAAAEGALHWQPIVGANQASG